jgi:pilus assembly protein CpaB
VRLQTGMRAVSIPIDRVKGVSGLVQPGDRVDVIAIPPRQANQPPTAVTILRGIRVLAIGTTLESASATPSPDEQNATTATLEVNPKQADLLAMADVNTTLRLALRSPEEPIRSEETEEIVWANASQSQPAPAPAPPAAPIAAVPAVPPLAAPNSGSHGDWPSNVQLIVGDQLLAPGSK